MSNVELASYATIEEKSRGRLFHEAEDDSKYRSIFGRDRDRIINSSAFRRLQYKTQVFVNHQGDHYRTRLTHSLEVAQVARWISGALQANKDLAEVVSLAHDLGHTPFGHAGEDALNEKMKNFGGFSHNTHTLKIITKIETRFIDFEGLNLSWEVLEGVVKHNGPISDDAKSNGYIKQYNQEYDLDLKRFPSIEAQISAAADDIAYNNHDIEDGLRAGLFDIEEIFSLPIIGKIYQDILAKYPKIKRELLVGEAKKKFTLLMVLDLIDQTRRNIVRNNIKTEEDVRNFGKFLVHFSSKIEEAHQALKKFLMENMYRHSEVNRMTANAKKIIDGLFDFYMNKPNCMPGERGLLAQSAIEDNNKNHKGLAIIVSDYIAGMTDRFAIKEFNELVQFNYK
ncbi:MAG: deoxyguanosinetriphosphate triphosphohydrolase [Rickettsiales bacterium]|nr:deoxyguanosinetriphosphate triphosphohydrolase [Rickettsiales bacterium]